MSLRKMIINILDFLIGVWMLFDGFHVLLYGKYFGPEKPGPWADLVAYINIDPFNLGPIFILYGVLWITAVLLNLFSKKDTQQLERVLAVLTLWYLIIGTLIAIIVLALHLNNHADLHR